MWILLKHGDVMKGQIFQHCWAVSKNLSSVRKKRKKRRKNEMTSQTGAAGNSGGSSAATGGRGSPDRALSGGAEADIVEGGSG